MAESPPPPPPLSSTSGVSKFSYTSLKDLLPSSPPEIQSWEDIAFKDPLLQKAAWAYIMTAEPVFNDRRLSSRLWSSRLLDHQGNGCLGFFKS